MSEPEPVIELVLDREVLARSLSRAWARHQRLREAHMSSVPIEVQPAASIVLPRPNAEAMRLADPLLDLYAKALDDLERTRTANENRARALVQVFGIEGSPEHARLCGIVDGIASLEREATLQLQRQVRRHPLGPWIKRTVGVGDKQGARLLAAIGDPYWNRLHDRPRTVSELWAYCGLHVLPIGHGDIETQLRVADGAKTSDPDHRPHDDHGSPVGAAPSLRKGQRANWSTVARMRTYLVAESCMKQRTSPYRAVYDEGRAKYAEAVHPATCARCGPSGKPAQPSTPLSPGHQKARALRLVMKAVLRDLWVEARSLHETETSR